MPKLVPQIRYFIQDDEGSVILKEYFYVEHLKDWNYYIAQEKNSQKYGILNSNCEEISDFNYLGIIPSSKGFKIFDKNDEVISAIAKIGDENNFKYILLNENGEKINLEVYDSALFSNFSYHLILKKGSKYGVIDYKNQIIIPFEYDKIYFDSVKDKYTAISNNISKTFDNEGNLLR